MFLDVSRCKGLQVLNEVLDVAVVPTSKRNFSFIYSYNEANTVKHTIFSLITFQKSFQRLRPKFVS